MQVSGNASLTEIKFSQPLLSVTQLGVRSSTLFIVLSQSSFHSQISWKVIKYVSNVGIVTVIETYTNQLQ